MTDSTLSPRLHDGVSNLFRAKEKPVAMLAGQANGMTGSGYIPTEKACGVRRKRGKITKGIVLALLGTLQVLASPAYAEPAKRLYESFALSNGMEVVLIENHRVPAVSHMLWVKAGATDDPAGKSGLAHYVEHMMFQGTPSVASGQYAKQVAALGGAQNAFTTRDATGYYVTIAKANLPKVMALEADRLQHLAPHPTQFAKEREVIIEERRMRVENEPAALFRERLQAALFLHHPYRLPVIGWQEEMAKLEWADVEPFYRAHYQPQNMVLVVAGDITRAELEGWAKEFYGALPNAAKNPKRVWNAEPVALAARRVMMTHPQAGQRSWVRLYTAPSVISGDTSQAVPLNLLSELMAGGASSRLYQSLVVKQKIAVAISVDYDDMQIGPGVFSIGAVPAEKISFEQLEKAIDAEIARVKTTPFPVDEIARAKTQLKAATVYAQDGVQGMAMLFGQLRALGLPLSYFDAWPGMVEAVTAAQIQTAAGLVFDTTRSVTGTLAPDKPTATKPTATPTLPPTAGDNDVH